MQLMTRVTVISTDKAHLQAISAMLKQDPQCGEIRAIEGGADALERLGDIPDVLVINGTLAENGGLDGVERLGQRHPEAAFIVVTENQSPEFLLRAMRAGVREVLPSAISQEQFHAAMARVKKRAGSGAADGKVLAFMPCKGGAGATFLAANLGYALAEADGRKVALIDLNVQFGDAAVFVSEERPTTDLATLCREIHRLDASLLAASMLSVSPNYALLAAPEDPAHAIDVKAQHVEVILKLARRQYDFVVLDLGRSLDAVTVQALDMADMVFPVLELNLAAIHDAKRLLGVLRSLGYPKSKINPVLNRHDRGAELTVADVEKTLGASIYRRFPTSPRALPSVNQGIPIAKLARNDAVARSLQSFAETLAPQARADVGWLSRVLGRP